jgi:uncharacterized protein YgiM (DUF1202 family)
MQVHQVDSPAFVELLLKGKANIMNTRIFLSFILFLSGVLGGVTASAYDIKVYRVVNVKASGVLHLREKPSHRSRAIVELPHDARWIVKRNQQKKYQRSVWQKVTWNDQEGWVNTRYLAFDPEATAIASARRSCLNSNTANKMCCGFPAQRPRSGKFYPLSVYDVVRVQSGQSLNMRSRPGRNGHILATIPHNAIGVVKLPGQRLVRGHSVWEKVRWNGRNGWVNSYFLKHDPALSLKRTHLREVCSAG